MDGKHAVEHRDERDGHRRALLTSSGAGTDGERTPAGASYNVFEYCWLDLTLTWMLDGDNHLADANPPRRPATWAAMTPQAIFHWFGPPELSRPDLRQLARALWIVSWPFFTVVSVVLGIAVLVEPQTLARRVATIVAVGALVTLMHTISRAGRPQLASWTLVIGLCVIVTQRAWITGGIHAPVAVFYALFIVMASVLIGVRGSLTTAAACFFGAIILSLGPSLQWLSPRPGAGSLLSGWVFAVLALRLPL